MKSGLSLNNFDSLKVKQNCKLYLVIETEYFLDVLLTFRSEISKLFNDNKLTEQRLQEHITALETELATKESELLQEKQVKEDLINQSFAVAQSQDSERELFCAFWISIVNNCCFCRKS